MLALPLADRVRTQPPTSGPLVDTFGRVHNNLRVSVTDRCNLRCTYCMPEEVTFLDKRELLTFEEIVRVVRALVPVGVDKVRLTGGEPLLRRGLADLVRMLTAIPGVRDVGLTTNGILLADQARALYDAGLRRLNVSLDSLDETRFRAIARRDGLDRVVDGILAAARAGFAPVKVNAVAIRGVNDADVVPLAQFARKHRLEMRFIEYMPIGAEPWERDKVLFASEILERIEADVGSLVPDPRQDPRAPALDFRYADGGGTVGIIASVSRPFCRSCNRVRLTAEGRVRNCLFAHDETDLKPLLRSGAGDAEIVGAVRQSIWAKNEGHEINSARFVKPDRTMHAIGG